MAPDKILTIESSPWCEDAARWLASTLRGVPCFTADDYRLELERNPDACLYRVSEEGGELVGFVLLRIERYQGGAEGVLLAAAGKLGGATLYGQVLPALEGMFRGVTSFRADPCRRGAIAELLKAGYLPTHVTMRKAAGVKAPAARNPEELLEALALDDTTGGPDLRATPRRLHKGGSSSSSTQQTTQNVDRRMVLDAGSIGFSSDGGTYAVNVLDQGAVQNAIDLVESSSRETLGFTRDIFAAGLTVLDKAGKQVEAQTALVAKAYDSAKGEQTQKNLVAATALAAVAIVAIKVWAK
jgi:hypothetical protein